LSGGGVAKICRKGYIKKFKALITIRPGSHCMEKISVTDTNISLPELLKRIEQGKTILILPISEKKYHRPKVRLCKSLRRYGKKQDNALF